MAIQAVDRDIRTLGPARFESQVLRQITPQRVHVTLGLLDLGLLLGTARLGDQVHRELVGGGATDEVGEVGELQVDWWASSVCRRGVLFESLRLSAQLNQERPRLPVPGGGWKNGGLRGASEGYWQVRERILTMVLFIASFDCGFFSGFFFPPLLGWPSSRPTWM